MIVGVHAQILGPFRVGDGARIGAHAVVFSEVPDGARMVGIPAKPVARRRRIAASMRAGVSALRHVPKIPDPIARALNGLLDEVTSLRARLAEIETKRAAALRQRSSERRKFCAATAPVTRSARPEDRTMRLSTKGRYAVMAMVDLAKHSGGDPISLAEIAERQEISLSYLEQLFAMLRKGGLVKSVRGPGGGYLLAIDARRDPHRRHHPRGRRADPRDALHAGRAGRLPRQSRPAA